MGDNMKKYSILILFLFSLVSGCSPDKIEEVSLYKMKSFSETKMDSLKVITESKDIHILMEAINGASKNPGLSDMIDPHYKVQLGEETYFLWIYPDSGAVMNLNDTHTTYSLTEKSVKEITELIKRHSAD